MWSVRFAWLAIGACNYAPPSGTTPDDARDAPAFVADSAVDTPLDGRPALACATNPSYVPHSTGIRYRGVNTSATWAEARDACIADEARLVVIEDLLENAHVDSLLTTEIWIGLSDLVTEGTFVWVDGSPLTFTNWRPDGNPNGGNGQNCVEFDETGGTWNDEVCAQSHPYVCECL